MKKNLLVITLVLIMPLIVNAEQKVKCYDQVFDVSTCEESCNFTCSGIKKDSITFKYNDEDYSKYFKLDDDKKTINIVDKNIEFDSNFEYGIIQIYEDDTPTGSFKIKNKAYTPPTTTTTTTTTMDPNIKEVIVTLDPNDGTETTTKTCKIPVGSETCSIQLPPLEKEGFNGWGTANTCKVGSSGYIRVEKDVTYYACYEDNKNESTTTVSSSNNLLLESLEILDKATNEKIEFGTFSIRKTEYEFKVLNSVENLEINAKAAEDVEIEITGNENLKIGENEILIKLKKDDTNSEYKLKVTRLKEGETINNIHYLKSLVIGGYENAFKFDKNTFIYNLEIEKDVKKLEITVMPEDESDKYEIKNNSDLVNGSQINIIVSNEEGESTTYIININKKETNNMITYIIIGLGVVLLILVLLIFITKNKKSKQNKIAPNTLDEQKKDIEILDI